METVALLYEDYQKELAEDFKNTFLKRASDTDSSRSNDTVIDEVTDMLSTNIAVYTEKLLQRWGFSSGGEGGGGGDVTVTLDDLLKKYLSDNYVTIKGDQEVFGEKDFRKGIRIAGRRLYWDEGNDALVIEGAAYTTRWLSAKGVSPGGGGAGSGGAAAMYQLIDVSPNDTKDAVLGAEKDYVLTFDGSFWRGMPNKGGLSSKLFTALDKEGNEVNPDDENAEIYAIRANYSLWSVGFLSAKGISDGGTGGGGGGAVALYQLLDVEKNADITGVAGATKGSVLTFNGDKWYADKPKTAAGISNLFTALDNDGNEVDLNDESKLGTITNIRANYALWSVDWISAKGKSSGGSGGGGGLINLVYGFESLGGTFDNNDNSATFNAFTINEIWKLASSGLTNVTVTGSGNAVTDVIKGSDGRSLTFTKGSTFATKSEFDALNTKFNDFLTGSDADDIINKWSELEVFLQGMKESDNLAVILQSKMDKTAFSKLFTALDASGNEVDPSDDTKTIASIRANFGFWGVDYISAKGVSKGSGGTGGASTLYQLVDVLANDTEDGVEGAAAGKALVFDGTHWRAGDAGLNESQLYSYLTANKYLTQSAADSRYVTSSRKVIAGTGLSGGGALTSDVTLSLGTSGVVAGTYTKVMVDAYGRVTSGTNLSATDIPNLDWSKITTGKPTTLAGYGITDAVTLTTNQTISGQKTFTKNILMNSGIGLSYGGNIVFRNTAGNTVISSYGNEGMIYFRPNGDTSDVGVIQINKQGHINGVSAGFKGGVSAARLSATEYVQIGDAYLKWDAANNAVYVIKKDGTTPVGFYSTDWLSAKGVSMSGAQTGTLDSLNDVEITDPVNGQALKYDAASKKWVNGIIDSFNVNQMWAELKKADSSKVIDASHIPTSVLDGRWVKKAGDTMTGTLTSASSSGSIVFKGVENCDITNIYKDNGVIKNDDGGLTSIRNGLRFNWYDTYWYIGNLRGSSTDSAGFGVVDHNNKLVLRVTPNDVRAPRFMSTVATGVSPLIVSSNTLVNNLNADLLDGLHENSFLRHRDTFGIDGYNTLWAQIGIRQYNNAKPDGMANPIYNYGAVVSLPTSGQRLDIWCNHNSSSAEYGSNGLQYRSGWNNDKKPWRMLLDNVNYASYSDGRYVKKSGDTMTGDLTMDNTKGFNIGWSTRVVKTSSIWIHGGSDAASVNDANLRFGSWQGIGWYPTISGQTVAQGKNAMWLNVRTGALNVAGGIKESTICIGRVNSAGNYDAAYNGEINRYDHHLFLQHHSGKYLIMCTGGGLAGIGTNSPGEKLHVAGNTRTDGYFKSTVGTGTQPYQCSSTTLNSNLNADLLDGYHQTAFNMGWTSSTKYRVDRWGGNQDLNWKKIVTYVNTGGGQYLSCKVKGTIYYITGNHNQGQVVDIPFEAIMYAYGGTANSMLNQSTLYLPPYCSWDLIRIVRYANNSWEVQVRQPSDWVNISLEYTVTNNGGSVSAGQFTNTSYSSTVANNYNTNVTRPTTSRVSSADKLTTGRTINGTTFNGTANITTSYWGTTRTFYTNSHDSYRVSAGVNVNGSGNVTLLLPNSIKCSDWFRSTGNSGWYHQDYGGGIYMQDSNFIRNYGSKRLRIQTDTYDTLQLVRSSGSGGSSIAFYNGGGTFRGQLGVNASSWFTFDTGTATANQNVVEISPAGGIHSKAEITAKASGSDIRLKKDIQNYNAMNIINRFRSVKYHWNDIAKANSEVYNNDYDQFGLIAQDLIAGGFEQWVRDVFHDYYTVTYERLIPVVWKGLQEVDDEVTRLKKRVRELENKLGINN